MGRHRHRYGTRLQRPRGHALCVIVVNSEQELDGVQHDIKRLEAYYESRHVVVIGGFHDDTRESKRDWTMDNFGDFIQRINHQYDESYRIEGAEYDKIVIHFFAPGNLAFMLLGDNTKERKINILDWCANALSNLQNQIPLALFLHSYPCKHAILNADIPEYRVIHGALHDCPNILGVHTAYSHIHGYNPQQHGSWVVQQFVHEMTSRHSLHDAILNVNIAALANGHQQIVTSDKGFKQLHFNL